MEGKDFKSIRRKVLIINIIILILLLILFQSVYSTTILINNEISFKNYLKEQDKYILNPKGEIETREPEKIKFPLYIYLVLTITLILLIEEMYSYYELSKKEKYIKYS
jgi:hypothetical protein